jgi:hypothetical protein
MDEEPELDLDAAAGAFAPFVLTLLKIIDANLTPEVIYRGYAPVGILKFGFEEIELICKVDPKSSRNCITCSVINWEYRLSRKIIDGIRGSVRALVAQELAKTDNALTAVDAAHLVLRVLEETTALLQEYRQTREYFEHCQATIRTQATEVADESLGDDFEQTARHVLRICPESLCRNTLPGFKLLHCETVLRNDLKSQFMDYQMRLRRKLYKLTVAELRKFVPFKYRRSGNGTTDKQQLVEYLVQPKITFHGTMRANVPSIVQYGFLKPGDKDPTNRDVIHVANGTCYGKGIYSTPDLEYALYYSERGEVHAPSELPGIKIFVCATIMGRTATVGRLPQEDRTGEPESGADSHASRCGLEYVVFNKAQILPCFVLHLDFVDKRPEDLNKLAKQAVKRIASVQRSGRQFSYLAPGDLQREKEERIARGKKFFAYGFGPVSGRNLVIEEVAEVDDDEEDYGDYQTNRIAWESYGTQETLWES